MKVLSLFTSASASDEALMNRVAQHDDDRAFDLLYHRHARRLMGFFYRQTGQQEALASDLTQEAFLRVWSARGQYHAQGTFRTWLFSIAYNLCKNHYRHLAYEQAYTHDLQQEMPEDYDPAVEACIDKATFDEALAHTLDCLPEAQRLLFSLRYEEELTVPQIAQILDIPEGTVKSRLNTLTLTLKKKLQRYGTL